MNYDHYGNKIGTVENDECERIMETIIFPIDAKYMHFSDKNNILSNTDKNLLIAYASRLFNTTPHPDSIENDMYGLVKLVWEYRLYKSPSYVVNFIREEKHFSTKYSHNLKLIEKAFIENLTRVIDFMDGDIFLADIRLNEETNVITKGTLPKPKKVKEILQIMRDNPNYYIATKPSKPMADKKKIKDYLAGLKLKNKTDEIKAFYKKI